MDIEAIRAAVLATIESIAPETDLRLIRADQPLRRQIDLDSIDFLNVIAGLHERLSIEIAESDYGRLETIDSIVAYLASRPVERRAETAPARAQLPSTRHLIAGIPVTVRPIRADDRPLEADFVQRLSADARYQRFMVTVRELPPAKLDYLTDVDQVRHVALVATVDRDGKEALVGVVRYIVDAAGTGCEFAVVVDDAWHGSGLAGILMLILLDIARDRGLKTMQGIVLSTNTRMLKFTRQLGFTHQRDPDDRNLVRVTRAL